MKMRLLSAVLLAAWLPGVGGAADVAAGKTLAGEKCASCHGADGNSAAPQFPSLAGQPADYVVAQLKAFQAGARKNDMMAPMAQGLSEAHMADIAAYFASQAPKGGAADPNLVALGQTLYRAGNAESGVPACMACHGPAGKGMAGAGFPALAGQHAEYVLAQLKAFKDGTRGAGAEGVMAAMGDVAKRLTDEEAAAVANYVQGLKAE
jgi:cytochrome c553